jgi:acetylglutamate kinase
MIHIVKIGGNVIDKPSLLDSFLEAFHRMDGGKVLVHGGGKLASNFLERLQIPVRMIDGRRITDQATLEIITMIYGGLINKQIVARLQALGTNAIGLTGADANLIKATKRPVRQGIDYGFAGDVEAVDANRMKALIELKLAPVLAPLTHNQQGQLLNTNADTIAQESAVALAASAQVTLLYCFENRGVMKNPEDPESLIPLLTPSLYEQYKAEGLIYGGMIPKLDNAFAALAKGVSEVVIMHADALQNWGSPHFAATRIRLA